MSRRVITDVGFLSDTIVVHYYLQKPYGIPDERGEKIIFYADIPFLSPPPEKVGEGDINWEEEIFVAACNKTIVFKMDSYCESDRGPNEHVLYGPFLKKT